MTLRPAIRSIEPADITQVAALIRQVMPEFGAAGEGFAIMDPEVDDMYQAYHLPRHGYFVVVSEGRVYGGGGYAPLSGGNANTCEIRKMYFYRELRGLGFGARLLDLLLAEAKQSGFTQAYIETLTGMDQAQTLYAARGFKPLCAPMGHTGHGGCDRWYVRDL